MQPDAGDNIIRTVKPLNYLRTAWALLGPGRPMILYHQVTARCDCRCRFCSSWMHQPAEDDAPSSERTLALLDRVAAAGFTTYTVWGGEPMMVAALPEWLRHAQSLGLETVVCTSGSRFPERAPEFAGRIGRLLLSLEAVGEAQDRLRNTPGLFERVKAGLEAWRKHRGGPVALWSNLSRENIDQVEPIARFAADQGIDVEFFPASPGLSPSDKLVLDAAERRVAFDRAAQLKRSGLPIRNTYHVLELMASGRAFRCHLPRLAVQVLPDGSVNACDPRIIPGLVPYGHESEIDFAAFHRSPTYLARRSELSACNRCLLPCVGNLSDNLALQAARQFIPGI